MSESSIEWTDVMAETHSVTYDPVDNAMVQEQSEPRRIDYVVIVERVKMDGEWINVGQLECHASVEKWPEEPLSDHYPIIATIRPVQS